MGCVCGAHGSGSLEGIFQVRIQLQSTRLALKPCVSMAFQGPWVTLPVLLPSNVSLERTRDSINPD